MMSGVFSEMKIRGVHFRNRIGVSPMCMYSAIDGMANDWHLVHLGSRAVGGAGLVIVEATGVVPEGRITPYDLGLWKDEQTEPLRRITGFMHAQGAVSGIQLGHAGRKAGRAAPWMGEYRVPVNEGGFEEIVAPSPIPYYEKDGHPRELSVSEIRELVLKFASAAVRAVDAGFKVIEIHAAHGYLIHEFLSPLSNHRTDAYGGSFEHRIRFLLEIATAIRGAIPDHMPLFARISCTDWVLEQPSWDLQQSVHLARELKALGVDLIDCSSGGLVPCQKILLGSGYQAHFSEAVRREAEVMTATVGMITQAAQADHTIVSGQADLVLIGRQFLRDPYFPLRAAGELKKDIPWPDPYHRAK